MGLPDPVVRSLAEALAPNVKGGASRAHREAVAPARLDLLKGVVTAVHAGAPGTVDVQTDGVHTRANVDCGYPAPAIGDSVYVLEKPPLLVVVCRVETF